MLRSTAARSLVQRVLKAPTARAGHSAASKQFRNATPFLQLSNKRPLVARSVARPTTISLLYATKTPFDPISGKEEHEILQQKLQADPGAVSGDSSVRHVFEASPAKAQKEDEMLAGVKADLETIKETFSLSEVPRESLYLGLAGLLPYAATSASTVFLSYEINRAHLTGAGLLFSPETAHQLLDLVTPIQIGYGAVIISFLGAIHWGLEYAGYGGHHSYRRYMIGVAAPAVAWPTIFMPIEYALITQFLAFNFLYFADARATARGWFPSWYSTYRFVLTFIVGASIVASLVGRGQIVKSDSHLKSPVQYVKEDSDKQWEALEKEEKQRRASLAKEEEDEEEEDGEGGDDDAEGDEEGDDTDTKASNKDGGEGKKKK